MSRMRKYCAMNEDRYTILFDIISRWYLLSCFISKCCESTITLTCRIAHWNLTFSIDSSIFIYAKPIWIRFERNRDIGWDFETYAHLTGTLRSVTQNKIQSFQLKLSIQTYEISFEVGSIEATARKKSIPHGMFKPQSFSEYVRYWCSIETEFFVNFVKSLSIAMSHVFITSKPSHSKKKKSKDIEAIMVTLLRFWRNCHLSTEIEIRIEKERTNSQKNRLQRFEC